MLYETIWLWFNFGVLLPRNGSSDASKDIDLDEPTPREPHMKRWVDIMSHHGGGPIISYGPIFFKWMRKQLIMIEDYAYAGMDFQGDRIWSQNNHRFYAILVDVWFINHSLD
jgi:hypothetical protein